VDYAYALLVGPQGSQLPKELQAQLAEAGFAPVRCRDTHPQYAPEPLLAYMLYLKDTQLLALTELGVARLSDLRKLTFAQAWHVLRENGLDTICRAMIQVGLGFSDLNPIVMDLTRSEHWHGLGLHTRITNALMRENIFGTGMLLALSLDDLRQIRMIGDEAIVALAGAQDALRSQVTATAGDITPAE
jgi:hypothetical protein